jgi:dipeptidyl aminopeptidase/acylaminoacyl peptidase
MKVIILVSICISLNILAFPQVSDINIKEPCNPMLREVGKPIIDGLAIDRWIRFGQELAISNNGDYLLYNIDNYPFSSNTLIIQSTTSQWRKEFIGVTKAFFTEDSKKVIFMSDDSLYILKLGTDSTQFVKNVCSYKQPELRSDWMCYQLKNGQKDAVLLNLITGQAKYFHFVTDYTFDKGGDALLLKTEEAANDIKTTSLQLVYLLDQKTINLYSIEDSGNANVTIKNYSFDESGNQLLFLIQQRNSVSEGDSSVIINTVWYFKKGMDKAIKKISKTSLGFPKNMSIHNSAPSFSVDGKYIYFHIEQDEVKKAKTDIAVLDVWSYRDTFLQSTQLYNLSPKVITAVIGTGGNKIVILENEFEKILFLPPIGDYAVLKARKSGDKFWSRQIDTTWLISLKDGSRIYLKTSKNNLISFSPTGKYIVYFNSEKENYFSYNFQTFELKNISLKVPHGLLTHNNEYEFPQGGDNYPVGDAIWLGDTALFVYDDYDIWKLDPNGQKSPTDMTNGYGRLHHLKFRFSDTKWPTVQFSGKSFYLLSAFNTLNKYNGFYRLFIDGNRNPEVLTLGPYCFNPGVPYVLPLNSNDFDVVDLKPVKAKQANVWIVKRQTTNQPLNYFSTTDFKQFKPLTYLEQNKDYNWLTAELVNFKQIDGIGTQGILYKPENFDVKKKYPLIITYYEQLSHRLYEFPIPKYSKDAHINIPWFVSHGYLVFTPDIHFQKGKMGRSAYNTVVSSALHLSKLDFVDSKRIGISGHSFGGFETNYILTHSNLFSAAIEGAGTSDWISSSLQLAGKSFQEKSRLETYEPEIGAPFWQRPDLYIENSPVFLANKVNTPLLIFHCQNDEGVPWAQAIEFFISLRRLGKKVWMLQYNNGGHSLGLRRDRIDFTTRITHFFDYYLKNALAPKWMTEGIPATLKGVETGFQFDSTGKKP